jgi:hypothetical protein
MLYPHLLRSYRILYQPVDLPDEFTEIVEIGSMEISPIEKYMPPYVIMRGKGNEDLFGSGLSGLGIFCLA